MIIIVDRAFDETVTVRWYLTDSPEECGHEVQPALSASRNGVMIGAFLHEVEGHLLDHAKGVHAALAKGDQEDANWARLALPTHVRVPWGPPIRVGQDAPAYAPYRSDPAGIGWDGVGDHMPGGEAR